MISIDKAKKQITDLAARRIRQFRVQRGWSQEKLAELAELNPAFLGHIERSLKCPTLDTLNKIATALNVSLSELLDFNEQKYESEHGAALKKITFALHGLSERDADRVANIVLEMVKLKED